MKKIVSLFLVILLITCSLSSCAFRNDLAPITDKWIPEQDDNIAIVSSTSDDIIMNGITYSISDHIKDQFRRFFAISYGYQAICVSDYDLYGVCDYPLDPSMDYGWFLYKINLITQELEILYWTQLLENPGLSYPMAYSKDAVIYMNDGIRTVTYDIKQSILNELPNNDFESPYSLYHGHSIAPGQKYECFWRENDFLFEIKNKQNGETVLISFDYIANRHEYFDQIRKYGEEIKPSKYNHLPSELFKIREVHILNDSIYMRVIVCDVDADVTAIIFRYDCDIDAFQYLYHEYVGDHSQSKVIPAY